MSASRLLLVCWAALATLSVCTVALARVGATVWLSTAILLVAVGKAWLITDGFMELRRAPRPWRLLMLSWALVLAAVVGLSLVSIG
ncbi:MULTISPECIES: cytochrome C oxidase subunit IV family protein [unclassified Pseudomonas]|uniref:cytochrome C oxidase subunit IV family protein n=1 Tax=unclassified Pseudomonas TaxID=196821 RepID=UPI002AC92969|nr:MULTISPECIES: cytochrome C oxidase subunit IV family protein [unclassified Pseudomonas]MEB0046693.1 cytochrome C oxidase subunit IV family protein [Pseudomonas sp. Dout3]MEB0098575.1 cytochrome C oxidase subunit IV family protein [Pseudomonas sp. DC1.2]WPX56651.1 cytochrome C oxidase subunit IV family protein [Pseudomonas sp. DC1.2]